MKFEPNLVLSVRWNLFAAFASSIWGALLALIAVPFYLKYLGVEAYGLVGFLGTLQALLSLLDAGLSAAINREVARAMAGGAIGAVRSLLHTLATIYWVTALVLALMSIALTPLLGQHWLRATNLSRQTLTDALLLMGWVVAARWPATLYLGTLLGAQRVVLSSSISAAFSTLASVGGVLILALVSPRIELLFGWQAAVGVGYALTLRQAAWATVGKERGLSFSWPALRTIWKFSAGITGIALSALLLTQVDKLILSRLLTLSDFGRYSVATLAVSSLYLLTTPMFNVVYPRLTVLVSSKSQDTAVSAYRTWSRHFALMIFPTAMILAVFANDLLRLWTRDAALAIAVAPVVSLLAIGASLHGMMYLPYALSLANANTRLPLVINVTLLALAVPAMALLTLKFGTIGAGFAGLLLYTIYFIVGSWSTHRKLSPTITVRWPARDVLPALVSCLIIGCSASWWIRESGAGGGTRAMLAVLMVPAALILALVLMPSGTYGQLRNALSLERS